jgi:MazG family protein
MRDQTFDDLVALMARLRSPQGCPWDREQTYESLRTYVIEEAYEVVDAVEARDFDKLAQELGDLLLQVVFYAQMATEDGKFDVHDVIRRLSQKLVHRHPHVFGNLRVNGSEDVLKNWERLKAEERAASHGDSGTLRAPSLLQDLPRALPALLEAYQMTLRASRVGFDWQTIDELLEKLREEVKELLEALEKKERNKLEEEAGDLLFVAVNVARFLGLDPEIVLRRANRKFRERFQEVEKRLAEQGKVPDLAHRDEMEHFWNRAKEKPSR